MEGNLRFRHKVSGVQSGEVEYKNCESEVEMIDILSGSGPAGCFSVH